MTHDLPGPTLEETPGEVTLRSPEPFRSGAGWAMLAFMLVWCGVWDFGCVAMLFPAQFPGIRVNAPPYPIRLVFPLVGGLMTLYALWLFFVRHAWTFGLGRITRHTRVLLTGLAWETRYEGVATIEFRHGIWESGKGHTDVLRFRLRGSTIPIEIDGLGLFGEDAGSSALGQLVAARVGVPYSAVTERIPDPSSD